jgi:hypothetical protein
LEKYAHALGHIVRHERRNADAEIDQHSRSKFPGNTAGDDDLFSTAASCMRDEVVGDRCRCHDVVRRDHANGDAAPNFQNFSMQKKFN